MLHPESPSAPSNSGRYPPIAPPIPAVNAIKPLLILELYDLLRCKYFRVYNALDGTDLFHYIGLIVFVMKSNIVRILLFILAALVIFGLATWQISAKNNITSDLNENCSKKASNEFGSRRSLALIIKNQNLLAIRLETESNYSPPGGHIQDEESPEQALSRELGEELQIKPKSSTIEFYKVYCELLGTGETQQTYLFKVSSWTGEFSPPSGAKLKWVNSDYLDKSRADTELNQALIYLKSDKLIN